VDTRIPIPTTGRTFACRRRIRLSDTDPNGRLRLDATARYLQDAATDDVAETGWGAPEHLWVVRRVRIDVLAPSLEDREVEIVTWSSGHSGVAAARRWSLSGDAGASIQVDSVWSHLGPDGRPARPGGGFEVYEQAAGGRTASRRLELPLPPPDAPRLPWPVRATDFDTLRHVNNAAYWHAVEELLPRSGVDPRSPFRAEIDHRGAIDAGDEVELTMFDDEARYALAFLVGDDVRAVARLAALAD
jgi:acyl-ACP thioesterase